MDTKLQKQLKRLKILAAVIVLLIFLIVVFVILTARNSVSVQTADVKPANLPVLFIKKEIKTTEDESPEPENLPESSEDECPAETQIGRRGTAQPIPEDIRKSMEGLSMRSNPDITYDDLSYLSVPHYDFSGNTTVGHMVVNRDVAEEVLDIFAELYDIGYPIERMELIDKYGADDYVSIDNNNTSAFNYRLATDGSGRLSKHAMGMAVDINPQINPYVYSSGVGSHENAREYWSRDYNSWQSETAKAAFIGYDTQIYKIFVEEHGWEWGGAWSGYRDYQHFQKTF